MHSSQSLETRKCSPCRAGIGQQFPCSHASCGTDAMNMTAVQAHWQRQSFASSWLHNPYLNLTTLSGLGTTRTELTLMSMSINVANTMDMTYKHSTSRNDRLPLNVNA
eukprot:3906046-Amphidinium_carterae.1